jgi:hypothetical protein
VLQLPLYLRSDFTNLTYAITASLPTGVVNSGNNRYNDDSNCPHLPPLQWSFSHLPVPPADQVHVMSDPAHSTAVLSILKFSASRVQVQILCVSLSACLSFCLLACLFVCLPACLPACLSACLSVCLLEYPQYVTIPYIDMMRVEKDLCGAPVALAQADWIAQTD